MERVGALVAVHGEVGRCWYVQQVHQLVLVLVLALQLRLRFSVRLAGTPSDSCFGGGAAASVAAENSELQHALALETISLQCSRGLQLP